MITGQLIEADETLRLMTLVRTVDDALIWMSQQLSVFDGPTAADWAPWAHPVHGPCVKVTIAGTPKRDRAAADDVPTAPPPAPPRPRPETTGERRPLPGRRRV